MHKLYFDRVVIFWNKYNEAPAELCIFNPEYNQCVR